MSAQVQTCLNCGNSFEGNYCNQCGEKLYHEHDRSIGHFFEEGFHFLTHFEGSFLTTISTIVRSPGKYSKDYCAGLRKKYFKPASLFMLLVVLYLLFPKFSGLNMHLYNYLEPTYDFAWAAKPLTVNKMKDKKMTFADVNEAYRNKSSSVSKVALFFMIPMLAVFTYIILFWKRKFFFDHLVICTEIVSFYIAVTFLILPFISWIAEKINPRWVSFFYDDNVILGGAVVLLSVAFASIALKRFFGLPWWLAVISGLAIAYVFDQVVFYLYRLIVLYITMFLV